MSILDYIDSVQARIEGLFKDNEGTLAECTAPPVTADDLLNENVRAAIMMVRVCEGTGGPDGFRMLFGGKLFDGFAAHPNVRIPFTQTDGVQNFSTAAGAGQFLSATWASIEKRLGFHGFTPQQQERGFVELFRQVGALNDIKAGQFVTFVNKLGKLWASMPSSIYPQPKRTMEFARRAYLSNGGVIAE